MIPVNNTSPDCGGRSVSDENRRTRVGIFACSAEYWTIGFAESTFSLKDIKGLNYIQRLLRYPGRKFHTLDFIAEPVGGTNADVDINAVLRDPAVRIGGLGDSGEMLDERAKQEYKRRLRE